MHPIKINQEDLKSLFTKYLRLQGDRDEAMIHDLENSNGLCLGFSLVYAAMSTIGKSDWWIGTLQALSKWDGRPESLNEFISLPDQKEEQTLGQLFERALSYVNTYQTLPDILRGKAVIDGKKHVLLAIKSLEIKDPRTTAIHRVKPGSIATALFKEVIPGTFKELLAPELLQGNCCVVILPGHACSIRFHENKYYFYEPNCGEAQCSSVDKLITCMSGLMALYAEAFETEPRLTFTIVDLTGHNRKAIHDFKLKAAQPMLDSTIMRSEYDDEIVRELPEKISTAKAKRTFTQSLSYLNSSGQRGWIFLANSDLKRFEMALSWVEPGQRIEVIKALCPATATDTDKTSVLGVLHHQALGSVSPSSHLNMISRSYRILEVLLSWSSQQDDTGETGWDIIAESTSKKLFEHLLEFFFQQPTADTKGEKLHMIIDATCKRTADPDHAQSLKSACYCALRYREANTKLLSRLRHGKQTTGIYTQFFIYQLLFTNSKPEVVKLTRKWVEGISLSGVTAMTSGHTTDSRRRYAEELPFYHQAKASSQHRPRLEQACG